VAERPVVVIRGGLVVDRDGTRRADVVVADGVIADVAPEAEVPRGATVLDAGECLVAPGLVDLHTHLRQPGREEAETVETGARAAALGGYTALVAMPNTEPAIDNAGTAREVLELGRGACAEVAVAGAITVGRRGEKLAPLGELAALGIRLCTDDGTGVQDGGLMRRALDYAGPLGLVLAQHCEDDALTAGGAMHEGEWSSRLGIAGAPAAAEEAMVARDLALVRLTGAPMHFLHLSTAGSVELVRRAKAEGLAVTAEAAPHHFTLDHSAVAGYDPVFRVNPPLRTAADVEAVRRGLCDGTLDAIATDHAPHPAEAKDVPFDEAPPGMLGLETAFGVSLTELHGEVTPGWHAYSPDAERSWPLPPSRIVGLLSWQPAAIAGLTAADPRVGGHSAHGGPLVAGADANLCVLDLKAVWTVDAGSLASRSRNSPYHGRQLFGRARHTVLRGEPVVREGEAQR
jgi:dihydroorotase